MTRRTLFMGLGLAVGISGTAVASERNRAADTTNTGEAAATVAREIISRSDNVAVVRVNGQERTINADGSVRIEQVIAEYGSVERAAFARSRAQLASGTNAKGKTVYADGAIAFDSASQVGTANPQVAPTTLVDLKKVSPWVEEEIGGVMVTFLANGVIVNDPNAQQRRPAWASHQQQVPSKVDQNGVRRYADGAVFESEPTSRTQGQ